MNFDNVPSELRIKRNWCVHKRDGERPKVPHTPSGYKMAWSIPANWINFLVAKKAYLEGLSLPEGHKCKFDGLGFFISREKNAKLDIYAVDLDHCIDPETGAVDQWARDLLDRMNSYSEISPSGTGIHVFLRGMLPEGSKNTNDQMKDKNRVEVFVNKHHITITGNQLKSYPATIEDRSTIIAAIYNEVLEVKASKNAEKKKSKMSKKRVIYDARAEAKKKYVAAAMEDEIAILKGTPEGDRNNQLFKSSAAIGEFVGAHHISRHEAEGELRRAAHLCRMDEAKDGIEATIKSGLDKGEQHPREIPELEDAPQSKLPSVPTVPQITVTPEAPQKTIQLADSDNEKESMATKLVNVAIKNSFECWHTPEGEAYITIPINSHREHYRISTKSSKIKAWLGMLGRDLIGGTPSISSIRDAINVLYGIALYDGNEYRLYVRKAEIDGKIYVDLGDPSWRAIEISEDGWKVIENCPAHFRRSKNTLPLPIPERGGEIDSLKGLINASTEENWILTLAWLSQAFWCRGPYAHLYLRGTQGTAKSYMMQTLKSISDPSAAIKRRLPKTERDAAIAIGSEALPCFDNLSGMSDDIADLWCVASTGGVSSQRALFTDDEEAIIYVKCPIIANGIEDLGQRGDLLDRTIVLDLEPIPEAERRTEKEMQAAIDENRSKLFACLLDMTVAGLNTIESIDLEKPPRMADFAEWACACLGGAAKRFIEIYTDVRKNTSIDLAEMNRLPAAIYSFVMNREGKRWEGSASLLLAELNRITGIMSGHEPGDWPNAPEKMGSELRRFSQALESKGIRTAYKRSHGGKRVISLVYTVTTVTEPSPQKPLPEDKGDSGDSIFSKKINDIERGVGLTPEKDRNKHSSKSAVTTVTPSPGNDSNGDNGDTLSENNGDTLSENNSDTLSENIRTSAMMEYGLNGIVDARKIAAKLKINLQIVTGWLDANYKKTDTWRYKQ